jgi:integrase
MRRLTQSLLHALRPRGTPYFVYDTQTQGFGVEVRPSGSVSFIASVRVPRSPIRRRVLGHPPHIGLEDARTRAVQYITDLKAGKNSLSGDASPTLGSLFEDLLANRRLKPATARDDCSTVHLCFPDWIDQPIACINRARVEHRFRRVNSQRGKTSAVKAFRVLSTLCNDAIASELIESNPVQVLALKRIDRTVQPRTRHLPLELIWAWVFAVESLRNLNRGVAGDYLLLLLHTGLRKNEGLGLRWDDVNLLAKWFVVRDTKNHLNHCVPIADTVLELFERRLADRSNEWGFSNRRGDGHLVEPRKTVDWVGRIIDFTWTLHDLRRTFSTLAFSVGLDELTVSRMLNHKTKSVTSSYIQTTAESLREPFQAGHK